MNWPKLKSNGRLRRTAAVAGLSGVLLLGVGTTAAEAAFGTAPGAVNLSPTSGPLSSSPTWATTEGCPAGYQASALLNAVESDGQTLDSVSAVVNGGITGPFGGSLLSNSTIAQIEALGGYSAGGVSEWFVSCYSSQSATGNSVNLMDIYVDYSANSYSTSTSGSQVPVGEIGGLVLAGLAAIGLVFMQIRRRTRRTQPIAG